MQLARRFTSPLCVYVRPVVRRGPACLLEPGLGQRPAGTLAGVATSIEGGICRKGAANIAHQMSFKGDSAVHNLIFFFNLKVSHLCSKWS